MSRGIIPQTRRPSRWTTCPDRKSTRLNSSHLGISYAVFCLKKKEYQLSLLSTSANARSTAAQSHGPLAGRGGLWGDGASSRPPHLCSYCPGSLFFFKSRAPPKFLPPSPHSSLRR